MQQHVDSGCQKCSQTLRTWQGVLPIAAGESFFSPPADAVHMVKSQFAVLRATTSGGVRLVFDSLLQPLTAGTRGSVAARQFLYETDDYFIDLRLEPRSAADRTCLVGQVLSRTGADRSVPGLTIRLQEGMQPIAHTSTNEFGEFQLEFEAGNGLNISIGQNEVNEVILPLYGVRTKASQREDAD